MPARIETLLAAVAGRDLVAGHRGQINLLRRLRRVTADVGPRATPADP